MHRLKSDNAELRHRHACHTAAAIRSQVSARSALVVEASLHEYTTGHPDRILHEVVEHHSPPNEYYLHGHFSIDHLNSRSAKFSYKGLVITGRTVLARTNEQCIRVCSHELKIL